MHSSSPTIGTGQTASLAVLISGGLDSAILLANLLHEGATIHPLYVRSGLSWEAAELKHLRRFLAALDAPTLRPLQILELPVADLYGEHWSITGDNVPDAHSPDAAVFLPGRNPLLLTKALLWCHLHGVSQVAIGSLETNPFPDATPEFFAAFQRVVNQAVGGAVQIVRPLVGRSKTELMQQGKRWPLELTFSCIHPHEGQHCGACNKCHERRQAFLLADVPDGTPYAGGSETPRR